MTVTLNLKPEVEAEIAQQAAAKGTGISHYLEQMIENSVTPRQVVPEQESAKNYTAREVLRAWRAQNATTDPAELEQRRRDWEEFKGALNESHTSSDRVLFP